MNTMGTNTRTVGQIRRTPSTAACQRSSPLRQASSMLSYTTMLLSRVMPMANATPAREMTLMVRPVASRPMKAAMVQTGISMIPIRVAFPKRRNRAVGRINQQALRRMSGPESGSGISARKD